MLPSSNNKVCVVLGAGGFIGGHLSERLFQQGHIVYGADIKENEFRSQPSFKQFLLGDLRDIEVVRAIIPEGADEVYQLAADMGGATYINTGDHDADVMSNSVLINTNVLKVSVEKKVKKVFYSSSACVYPEYNQLDPTSPKCSEDSVYPAAPDSEYGWEKLFSERLYKAFEKQYNLNVRIARFHNIYGPYGTYEGGKEKAPAAICRKVAAAAGISAKIEVIGDGEQTRSFLYIDDCLDAVELLMASDYKDPINIGSEEMVTINELVRIVGEVAKKSLTVQHIAGPQGVRGRNSDNAIIRKVLSWNPRYSLRDGLEVTYKWISQQMLQLQSDLSNHLLGAWITSDLTSSRKTFTENTPFPHILIENFFNNATAEMLSECFPDQSDPAWKEYNNPLEVKYAHNDMATIPPIFKKVFTLLQSPHFIDHMKQITGIENLEADPLLHGAGLHFYPNKGKLDLHLDYSLHPILKKERRVNLIIYINKEFKESWGGSLELRDPSHTIRKKIQPKFNSAILFQTSDISIHGVPEEIICPVGKGRKSIAIYYISEPRESMIIRHKAEFLEVPEDAGDPNRDKKVALRKIRKDRLITKKDLDEIWKI